MKIVVCIKQVPDTTEIKLDPVTGTMIRDGVPSIMNPDDKGGLEMALALKNKYGAQVTVITMGPPQADDILREAFAMGADRAIHLSDRKFAGADTLATSNAIAGAGFRPGHYRPAGDRWRYGAGRTSDCRASRFATSDVCREFGIRW